MNLATHSIPLPRETVTACDSCCTSPRLCRQYRGLWLCLSGSFNCYRHREIIYTNKQEERRLNNATLD